MLRFSLTLLFAAALIASCTPPAGAPPAAPAVIAEWSGQQGGGEQPVTRVVRTAEEWQALWRQLERDMPRPLQAGRELAFFIAAGQKRTGGFSLELRAARVSGGQLLIEFAEVGPAPGMMVTQAITEPWLVAVVAGTDRPVVFRRVASP